MHVLFPFQLLKQAARFQIVGQSVGAQQSISGATTAVASMSARWQATASFVLRDEDQHLAFRAFLAGMEGILGTTNVPVLSRHRPLDRDGNAVAMTNVARLQDAQTFQHFGFANAQIVAAVLAEPAALRATLIKVDYLDSTGLRPGHRFSINGRLYEVQLTWVDDAGDNVVQFQPPLRAAAALGAVVDIHHPSCLMRFADAVLPPYDELSPRMQTVSLSFVEAT